jgi:hypothetical protein
VQRWECAHSVAWCALHERLRVDVPETDHQRLATLQDLNRALQATNDKLLDGMKGLRDADASGPYATVTWLSRF